jgi:hypothetical protein
MLSMPVALADRRANEFFRCSGNASINREMVLDGRAAGTRAQRTAIVHCDRATEARLAVMVSQLSACALFLRSNSGLQN